MPLARLTNMRDDARSLRWLLLAAMTLGFLALAGAGFAVWRSTEQAARYTADVEHSYQAIEKIAELQVALERSETARRGYILSGEREFERTYARTVALLAPQLAELRAFTADNPRQSANVAKADRHLRQLQTGREQSMARVRADDLDRAFVEFQTDGTVEQMRAIRGRLRAMTAEEQRLLVIRAHEQRRSTLLFYGLLASTGALAVLVAILTLLTVLRYVSDLGASRQRLAALNDSLEDTVAERTADLTRANDEIQRFAYIVSHDLRSPLVNVMGFTAELEASTGALAELVDRAEEQAPDIVTEEARLAAREDLPEAIGFIRTSTQKMDRLINAILKLSREGRRTIAVEAVDMTELVSNIRATLTQQLDAKGAEIAIEAPLPTLHSDRLALDQIFGNVVENAVKYLDPARPGRIVVRGTAAHGRALFEIADNGRGIDPRDHARVFDLFRRSGAQDQPGEGIGLAHVRAMTYRLGGTIDVASELGKGATFRISLPIRYIEPAGASE